MAKDIIILELSIFKVNLKLKFQRPKVTLNQCTEVVNSIVQYQAYWIHLQRIERANRHIGHLNLTMSSLRQYKMDVLIYYKPLGINSFKIEILIKINPFLTYLNIHKIQFLFIKLTACYNYTWIIIINSWINIVYP